MNSRKRPITDRELDALLSGNPLSPADCFAERVLIKAAPVTEDELNTLLSSSLHFIRPDFTEQTLARIQETGPARILVFPGSNWLLRAGMVAALVIAGLFSYDVWQGQNPSTASTQIAQVDIAEMELEELLYLEETLASAKVLIELGKTVPLYMILPESDS